MAASEEFPTRLRRSDEGGTVCSDLETNNAEDRDQGESWRSEEVIKIAICYPILLKLTIIIMTSLAL